MSTLSDLALFCDDPEALVTILADAAAELRRIGRQRPGPEWCPYGHAADHFCSWGRNRFCLDCRAVVLSVEDWFALLVMALRHAVTLRPWITAGGAAPAWAERRAA